jgi:uncharacterized protein YecT (DUF1311 family)
MNRLHFILPTFGLLLAIGCSAKATPISGMQVTSTAPNATASTGGTVTSAIGKNSASSVNNSTPNKSSVSQANCPQANTQAEINQCLEQAAIAADQKLNQTYQQLLRRYDAASPARQKLVDAQIAWIKYRDATCAFSYTRFSGGSIAPSVYSSCIKRVTEQRITDFESYMTEGLFY